MAVIIISAMRPNPNLDYVIKASVDNSSRVAVNPEWCSWLLGEETLGDILKSSEVASAYRMFLKLERFYIKSVLGLVVILRKETGYKTQNGLKIWHQFHKSCGGSCFNIWDNCCSKRGSLASYHRRSKYR
ncbi:MAG: hypothetical protein QXX95_08525 [Nitrososphaerales archaeon]